MKILTIIISLLAMLGLSGCSDDSANNSMSLVPPNAAKLLKTPAYKLEHTTEGGIKCYVRPLVPEIARTITLDNPDYEYLKGDDINPYYLLVLIRNNKIIDKEATDAGALSEADQTEIDSFLKTFVPRQEILTNAPTEPEISTNEVPANEPAPEMPPTGENK